MKKILLSLMLATASILSATAQQPEDFGTRQVKKGSKTYLVYDVCDSMQVYKDPLKVPKANCFFVISKREYRLYVYERVNKDTLLVAHYPICYAKNPENKERVGDMKTPECGMKSPFTISQIADASSWKHDFGDGRGNIPSYGNWFMRLVTPGHKGIGIHGSTNNSSSVPGRDSEGCIRLRDNDIKHLKEHYAKVGTPVVVKSIKEGKLPFELKAEKALGSRYVAQRKGYVLEKGAVFVDK